MVNTRKKTGGIRITNKYNDDRAFTYLMEKYI